MDCSEVVQLLRMTLRVSALALHLSDVQEGIGSREETCSSGILECCRCTYTGRIGAASERHRVSMEHHSHVRVDASEPTIGGVGLYEDGEDE